MDDVIFGAQTKKIFEGQIVSAALDKVGIRERVDDLEQEVLEEQDRRDGVPSGIPAVVLFEFFVDEGQIDQCVELPQEMVRGYDSVINSFVFTQ